MNQLWSGCSQNKPMWSKCSHQPYGENIFRMLLGKFQMTANCYGGSNVVYMLILHFKYCINVLMGSRLNTWSGYIWNVPNLLLAGKWQVPSTRAYNVLKMFLLVSRSPRPQWLEKLQDTPDDDSDSKDDSIYGSNNGQDLNANEDEDLRMGPVDGPPSLSNVTLAQMWGQSCFLSCI